MKLARLFQGLLFIAVGIILLANTMGFLPWSLWRNLLSLWPIFIIGLGLRIATRKEAFVPLALLVMVVWAVMAPSTPGGFFPFGCLWMAPESTFFGEVPMPADEARVVLKMGASKMDLRGGASDLLEAQGRYRGQVPRLTSITTGALPVITLDHPGGGEWKIRLNENVILDISVQGGASSLDMDLMNLQVRNLEVESAASSVQVRLGNRLDWSTVSIDAKVSSVKVSVPQDTGVRVRVQGALSSHNLGEMGFSRVEDQWLSPGYDQVGKRINLDLQTEVGSLRLTRY